MTFSCVFPVPWQEAFELAGGMALCHAVEDIAEPCMGFDAIEFAGLDERGDGGPVFGSGVMAGEECILPIEGHHRFILPMSGRW